MMDADGSNQTRLTFNPAVDAVSRWSPDGSKILYESDRDGNHEIYVMNADGSDQTRLTFSSALDLSGSWSPDGTKILFSSGREGSMDIYVMNADGSNQTRLTNNPDSEGGAAYSPDGTKIAFSRDKHNFRSDQIGGETYVMDADGSNETPLVTDKRDTHCCNSPVWSPDGSKIAFSSSRGMTEVETVRGLRRRSNPPDIYVIDADGSNEIRLTSSPGFDMRPSWSPDGSKIAFMSFNSITDSDNDIYVMDADGSNLTRITTNPGGDGAPSWTSP